MLDSSCRTMPALHNSYPHRVFYSVLITILLLMQGCNDKQAPVNVEVIPPQTSSVYMAEIQPIFNQRCIACHGCLGSPCNLKLKSFRGVERGAFQLNPYSVHFGAYPRTDMDFMQTTEQWRTLGFYPVVSRGGTEQENTTQSLLAKIIAAGYAHNQPGFPRPALMPIYAKHYDHTCPSTPEALDNYLTAHPAAGMPFGISAINQQELKTLQKWIASGSPGPTAEEIKQDNLVHNPAALAQWEAFFNTEDPRYQLVARYIFEHVFLASIVLEESPGDFFRLVRSKTAPAHIVTDEHGKQQVAIPPIEIIATGLPYDNPYTYAKVDKFYYRLQKITTPIVQKDHFVWRLKLADIEYLSNLFFAKNWGEDATQLNPPWDIGNPFQIFQAIPAASRYQFLLENSELIVGGITYGPVCLGQTATYAIKDHFWVYFIDPKYDPSVLEPTLGLKTWEPFLDKSPFGNAEYVSAYATALQRLVPDGLNIQSLWNGNDGTNNNAWLTVLRHNTNVSVLKGRQGGMPPTQWLISYSGLERLYYDTVASFKYWAGDGSKLETLVFFNYLRQEMEDNFLLLLPKNQRVPIREQWAQGVGAIGRLLIPFAAQTLPTEDKLVADLRPLLHIVDEVQHYLGEKISGPADHLNPWVKPQISLDDPIHNYDDWEKAISTLTVTTHYKFPRFLPSLTLIKVNHNEHSRVYSMVANRVYKTQFSIVFQDGEAVPDEDTMSVYPTIIAGFPNMFMEVNLEQAAAFLRKLRDVKTSDDFITLRNNYGILRNSLKMWPMLDWMNAWNFKQRGIDAGYLDLTYYDLLDKVY